MTAPSSLSILGTPPIKAPDTGYFRWHLRWNKSNRSSPQPSIGSSTPATPRSKRRRAPTRDFSPELSPLTLLANASIAGQLPPKPKKRRRRSSSESSQGRLRFPDDVVGSPKHHDSSHSRRTAEQRKTLISQPSLDSIGSYGSSSKLSVTSLGDRVRKLYYGQPGTLPAQNTPADVTSPQLTTLGHQWTRELSGRRFEIKISHKQPSVVRPTISLMNKDVTEMTKTTAVNARSKAIFLRKLIKREEPKLETSEINGSSAIDGRGVLNDEGGPNDVRKEGLFNRTRRLLGFKGVPSPLIDGSNGSDLTKEYLNRVSSVLDMPMEEFDSLSRSSGTTDLSIAAIRPHKGPGLYRRHSTRSISSSLREAARGKTPPCTPNREPSFALNLPDHLASSALCPTNPNHSSKGKGVCIIHGRNRGLSNSVDD